MRFRAQVALVTGASSGIGRATATLLAGAGIVTYAAARRLDLLRELEAFGCRPIQVDVGNEDSLNDVVSHIKEKAGPIDLLINNAGFGHLAPFEEIDLPTWRRQFEINVFGLAKLTQLVLPGMRAARRGRIINVSSEAGEMTFPLCAAYSGSKRALEAINDALRFEVLPWNIQVISIQPGAVRTPLGDAAAEGLRVSPDSPYAGFVNVLGKRMGDTYRRGLGVLAPEQVAAVILRAATVDRPRTRYKVGPSARTFTFLRRRLSDRQWDWMMSRLLLGSAAREH